MIEELTERRLRAWRDFLSVSVQTLERLDNELQKTSQLSLTDYEILLALSEADEVRLRMSDLASEVLVSRSRLTYRVDRLTEVDYVRREECEDDRRGLWAILTETGRSALEAAKVDHHRGIQSVFFEPIAEDELEVLEAVFSRLDQKLSAES